LSIVENFFSNASSEKGAARSEVVTAWPEVLSIRIQLAVGAKSSAFLARSSNDPVEVRSVCFQTLRGDGIFLDQTV